jgi:hypothetical protein
MRTAATVFWFRFRFLWLLSAATLSPAVILGADFSTTGVDRLQNFFARTDIPSRPVTVLSFGDSMADSYRSLNFVLMNRFVDRLGLAGFSLNTYAGYNVVYPTNGALYVAPDDFWFTTTQQLPPGSTTSWGALSSPGGELCDRVGLFFISHPNGGELSLLISTNAGEWAPLFTLDAFSSAPQGQFTNVDLPLNYYRLRVDSLTGTNRLIGAQFLNTQSNGVHVAFMDEFGISLSQVTNVPLSIREPIFKALGPDLLIWHMKEDGSPETLQHLFDCEQSWSNCIPQCNIIYIGTPYVYADTYSTITTDQNTIVRSVAVSCGRTYMDCMTPSVSFDWMLSRGYMADGTHENLAGDTYLSDFTWDSLNFFSLRTPRKLSLSTLPDSSALLSWQTSTNILYQLESSPDLNIWTRVYQVAGDGNARTFTNRSGSSFYRLRMTPN